MKKIFKLYILTLLISFIGIISVSADTKPTLSLEGNTTISLNGENSFNIKINTNKNNISKISFKIEAEHDEYVTIRADKGERVVGSTNNLSNIILNSASDFLEDGSTIATLNIKNNGGFSSRLSSSITISNIVFTYNDENVSGADAIRSITLSNTTTTTTKASGSNAKLRNIGLNNGASLSPEWSTSNNNYKIHLLDTIRSLTLSPDCETCIVEVTCGKTCTITATGNQYKADLAIGKNEVTIKSRSTDGRNTEEYKLILYRGETTDNSKYLSSLEVNGYVINELFDRLTIDYSVSVPFEIETLEIFANPEDSLATVEIKNNENLQVGENIITVTVTSSETKDKTIYNINVTRLEEGEKMPEVIPPINEELPTNKNKWLLIAGISVVGIIIIGTSGYAIFGRKKNNKKNIVKNEPVIASEVNSEETKTSLNVFAHDDANSHTVDTALLDIMNTKEIIKEQTSTINLEELRNKSEEE